MCSVSHSTTTVTPVNHSPAPHPAAVINLEPLLSSPTSSASSPQPNAAATLYPDWDRWRFRRTLAYWITVMYLEGSILFTVGGAFAFLPPHLDLAPVPHAVSVAAVSAPYLIGSVAFTLGGWAGMEEVLRLPGELRGTKRPRCFLLASRRHWRRVTGATSSATVVGFAAYFVGALLFNVNCVAGFLAHGIYDDELWVWAPAILGSCGFVVGGLVECQRSHVWSIIRRRGACGAVHSAAVGLSLCNACGGALFLLAAVCGALHVASPARFDEAFAHWLSDGAYLLGSALFVCGSLCGLWMWKAEQYGLGLLPELNPLAGDARPLEYAAQHELLAQYGCGKSTGSQLPWLLLYVVLASASVIDVALSVQPRQMAQLGDAHRVAASALNFALSHGILGLGSVLHHVPTAAPHSWLLRYMRAVLLLYTLNSWFDVAQRIGQVPADDPV